MPWGRCGQTWSATPFAQRLPANAAALSGHAEDQVWEPDGRALLFRAGRGLGEAGLVAAAFAHFDQLTADATTRPDAASMPASATKRWTSAVVMAGPAVSVFAMSERFAVVAAMGTRLWRASSPSGPGSIVTSALGTPTGSCCWPSPRSRQRRIMARS